MTAYEISDLINSKFNLTTKGWVSRNKSKGRIYLEGQGFAEVTFNRKARHTQLNGTGGFPTNVIKEINNMFKSEDDSIRARVYTNGYSDYCFVVFGRWNQDVIVKAILDNMSKVFTKNTDGKELKIAECIATHIKDQKPEPVEFTEENGKIRLENTNGSNRNSLFAKEKFIVIK